MSFILNLDNIPMYIWSLKTNSFGTETFPKVRYERFTEK